MSAALISLTNEQIGDYERGESKACQSVKRSERDADILLPRRGNEDMLQCDYRTENRHPDPQNRSLRAIRGECAERNAADCMQCDAYIERCCGRESGGYRMQTVRAVEIGVLQCVYYVEPSAPCHYEQRQNAGR